MNPGTIIVKTVEPGENVKPPCIYWQPMSLSENSTDSWMEESHRSRQQHPAENMEFGYSQGHIDSKTNREEIKQAMSQCYKDSGGRHRIQRELGKLVSIGEARAMPAKQRLLSWKPRNGA